MASPAIMSSRPRRSAAARGVPAWRRADATEEDEFEQQEEEDQEEEEQLQPRGRRAGKEPVEEAEEDYEPEDDEEEEEEGGGRGGRPTQQQQQQQQRGSSRLAGSRRPAGGRGDEPGPSAKRGRRGALVKEEPTDDQAGPARRALAPVAEGAPAATAGELRRVDELIAEYRRVRDHAEERAQGKAPRMAMEQAARAVVRHMLFAHSEKPGVPVKRAELTSAITTQFPNLKSKGGQVTNYVIAYAQHYLASAIGLEMRSQHKAAARGRDAAVAAVTGEEGSQQYALRSIVPPALRAAYVLDGGQDAHRGLLMTVLALLQLAGGKLEEGELYSQLEGLGVAHEEPHPVFGKVPELLKSFCTRRYLQADRQQGPDGEVVTYRFAEQAVGEAAEVGEAAIKRFVDELMQGEGGGGAAGGQ